MKQFLRFQIAGTTCLMWTALFFLPYLNWQAIAAVKEEKLFTILIGLIAFALPLGTIIHQISISLLSPFRSIRFFNKRKVATRLEEIRIARNAINSDKKNQSILVFAKGIKLKWTVKAGVEKELDVESIRCEIESRYSYYYVRVDNGIVAPLFGYGLFRLLHHKMNGTISNIFLTTPSFPEIKIVWIAVAVGLLMLIYVPALLREVDDIEKDLLLLESTLDTERVSYRENCVRE